MVLFEKNVYLLGLGVARLWGALLVVFCVLFCLFGVAYALVIVWLRLLDCCLLGEKFVDCLV